MLSLSRRAVLSGIAATASARAFAAQPVVIGYQPTVDPSKAPQVAGLYEAALGRPITWRAIDGGEGGIAALAAGEVDIACLGSAALAIGASRAVPFAMVFVVGILGDNEALVVRDGVGAPGELVGRRIAVSFASTAHYGLLAALHHWGIDPATVAILDMDPARIAAAWSAGAIDAAYVRDATLGKLKRSGTVLVSSRDVMAMWSPTFDGWVARRDLIETAPELVEAFVRVTGAAQDGYLADRGGWAAENAGAIARLTGARAEDVPALLAGYKMPTLADQLSGALLGGGIVQVIAETAAFLAEQGVSHGVPGDYSAFIDPQFAARAVGSE